MYPSRSNSQEYTTAKSLYEGKETFTSLGISKSWSHQLARAYGAYVRFNPFGNGSDFSGDGYYYLYRIVPFLAERIVKFCNQQELQITQNTVELLVDQYMSGIEFHIPKGVHRYTYKLKHGVGSVLIRADRLNYLLDNVKDKEEYKRLFGS